MTQRARRSTRTARRIVYTEQDSDGADDGRVRKRKAEPTDDTTKGKKARPNKKTLQLADSSSLSSLDGSPSGSLAGPSAEAQVDLDGTSALGLARQILDAPGRAHPMLYHTSHLLPPNRLETSVDEEAPKDLHPLQASLLRWFDQVKLNREMPWRKEVLDIESWSEEQKGQRAYEVWVSEIMLQQTQVETVKSYYLRWMSRFPTIFDLAKADVEQVNECWQGLGYYSRASRLLSGAKKVVDRFAGVLPQDPSLMEKEVDGIGPYSAGAIASIAYAKPVPMVDGNVHRVLSRITALYAPQAAKATTKFLWSTAAQLVPQDRPGDFNQALMELGATLCKPREANCVSCPLSQWCRAYQEKQVLCGLDDAPPTRLKERGSHVDDLDMEDVCGLCQPLESRSTPSDGHVLIYPMAKERKKAARREVAVCLVIWQETPSSRSEKDHRLENAPPVTTGQTKTLVIKRPEKGLLAGLWEFPSIDLPTSNDSTGEGRREAVEGILRETIERFPEMREEERDGVLLRWLEPLADIEHVFSHLKVTYKSQVLVIQSPSPPILRSPASPHSPPLARWSPCHDILTANLGNPHKKVWLAWLQSSSAASSPNP